MAAVEMALTTGRNNILASCHQVPRAWLSATLVRVDIPSPHQASFERRNVLLALARLVVVGDGVTARNSWSLQVLHLPSAVQDWADEATFCLWQKRRCLLLRAVLQIQWGAFRAGLRSMFSVRGAAGLVSSRLRLCLWVALVCCGHVAGVFLASFNILFMESFSQDVGVVVDDSRSGCQAWTRAVPR